MKTIAIATLSLLACLSYHVLADELATPTPTPTPVYPRHFRGSASERRMERLARQRQREADYESKAAAREQARTNRRATANTQAQAKAADRAREQAQRQVETEARQEAARETPHPTSDLMKRMGFSQQEVAAQKAREESAKPGVTPSSSQAKVVEAKPASASPAPDPSPR
jgi:hypothetical protein